MIQCLGICLLVFQRERTTVGEANMKEDNSLLQLFFESGRLVTCMYLPAYALAPVTSLLQSGFQAKT